MPATRRTFLSAATAAATAVQAAQARQPLVVAVCKADHAVALVHPETLETVAKIPTGEGPHEVCTAGAFAYVAIYGVGGRPGHQLGVIDVAARREVKRVSTLPLRAPHGLFPIGNHVYFSAEQSRAVGRLDTTTGAVDWSMGTGQYATHMVVATPDGRKLYTANISDNTVSAIEVTPAKPGPPRLTQIAVGPRPEGIAITPDGRQVWAGHNEDGRISIIDTATDQVKATIPASKMAFRLAFTSDGKTCVVAGASGNELVLIDTATHAVQARVATPGAVPQGILLSPDNRWLYAATGPALLRIDLARRAIVHQAAPGAGVDGLAWFAG